MKEIGKRKYDSKRSLAITKTALKFGVTESYVRMVDLGFREAEEIKAYYRKIYNKLSKVLAD